MTVETTQRHWKDIPLFKGVTDEQWNDWRWQVRNRLSTVADFDAVLNLTDPQRADLEACMGKFRVAVTPYYASLMDPDDPTCPVRVQGVPSPMELIVGEADMEDAIAETIDSPTTLITHRYPDRVLFLATEMCSMYCRHCTRRRIVGESEGAARDEDYENAFTYIKRNPEVRDVLISGGDPLTLSDEKLEWLLQRVTEIDHVEIVRLGTRMPVVCPQRITPELCAMLKKYHPLFLNTHFNHPKEITEDSARACAMLADAGISLGNQTVLMRGVNDCAKVMMKLVRGLVKIRVKPYYFYQCDLADGHRPLPHFGLQGPRDLREPARPHHRLRGADVHHRRHRRRREDAGDPAVHDLDGRPPGHPAQLRGRHQQVRRARRLQVRVPLRGLRGRAGPHRRERSVRHPRTRARRRLGGALAEGARSQEPDGRHPRAGRRLGADCGPVHTAGRRPTRPGVGGRRLQAAARPTRSRDVPRASREAA